jgi:aldehyde dehydrogenase (NAD+)
LRETFRKGVLRPLAWRKEQLYQLARLAQDNADAIAEAISQDMGKPKLEVYFAEVAPVVERCLTSANNLEEWAKPEIVNVPDWQKPWTPTLYKAPKGVVLIISSVNLLLRSPPRYSVDPGHGIIP